MVQVCRHPQKGFKVLKGHNNHRSPGMTAVYAKTIIDADVVLFAGVSGDTNPLHFNEAFASQIRFKGRIVLGMVPTRLRPTPVGTRFPGPQCPSLQKKS